MSIPFHPLHLFGFMTNASDFTDEKENHLRSFGLVIVVYVSAKGIPRLERKCLVLSLLSASEVDSLEFFAWI